MLGFFFKKNFYEGWDNAVLMFVPNLILDAILVLAGCGFYFGRNHLIVWAISSLLVFLLGGILVLAWANTCKVICDYRAPHLKAFFKGIPSCIKDGLLYGLTLFLVCIIATTGSIYFLKPALKGSVLENGHFVELMAGCVYVWVSFTVLLGLFYYPAMRAILHNSYLKSIRKCYIVLFDNLGKSVVFFLYNLMLFFISVVMMGLIPGLAGITLSRVNSLRIMIRKYDYLEELDKSEVPLGDPRRRHIPWKELNAADMEITGQRTFKNFVMPWKE